MISFKNDTAMQTIDHEREFQDGAYSFEIHVSNLENMEEKLISSPKAEQDHIFFRRIGVKHLHRSTFRLFSYKNTNPWT